MGAGTMTISLVGLTLRVADVDRSVEFYRQTSGAAVLFHLPGPPAPQRPDP